MNFIVWWVFGSHFELGRDIVNFGYVIKCKLRCKPTKEDKKCGVMDYCQLRFLVNVSDCKLILMANGVLDVDNIFRAMENDLKSN